MNDQDCDVRIRACTLIEKLWIVYNQEKESRKRTPKKEMFFENIKPAELLVECARDINRVVRIEAFRVISSILLEKEPKEAATSKREYEDEFTSQFLNVLSGLDMIRLKESLSPEHLYEEAFDINADMMTQSIVPSDPDDDMNMLDCY